MPDRDEVRRGLVTSKFIYVGDNAIEVPAGLQLNRLTRQEHKDKEPRMTEEELDKLYGPRQFERR